MKNLLLLIFVIVALSSCAPTEYKVDDSQKETTVEIQQMVQTDTVCYKVVELNNNLYIINTTTNLIEYKANDRSRLETIFVFLLVMFFIVLLIAISTD